MSQTNYERYFAARSFTLHSIRCDCCCCCCNNKKLHTHARSSVPELLAVEVHAAREYAHRSKGEIRETVLRSVLPADSSRERMNGTAAGATCGLDTHTRASRVVERRQFFTVVFGSEQRRYILYKAHTESSQATRRMVVTSRDQHFTTRHSLVRLSRLMSVCV